jgi:hypothetical protein
MSVVDDDIDYSLRQSVTEAVQYLEETVEYAAMQQIQEQLTLIEGKLTGMDVRFNALERRTPLTASPLSLHGWERIRDLEKQVERLTEENEDLQGRVASARALLSDPEDETDETEK